jgi:hypothetical protein
MAANDRIFPASDELVNVVAGLRYDYQLESFHILVMLPSRYERANHLIAHSTVQHRIETSSHSRALVLFIGTFPSPF